MKNGCCKCLLTLLMALWTDLLIMLFLGSQESLDTSTLTSITMRAMFTHKAIFIGNLGAHLLANVIVILGAFLFTYPF